MSAMHAEQLPFVRPTTGREIAARRERLGLRIKDLAGEADVSRDTLSDWERGTRRPQQQTVDAVVAALDRLEEEMGIDAPAPGQSSDTGGDVVEFRVAGNFGVDVVVKGPIRDMDALEASVTRLVERLAADRRKDEAADDGESTSVD